MDNELSAADIAEVIAKRFQADGVKVGRSGVAGAGSSFDFVAIRLPNGQEFTIRIEEN